LFVKGDSYGFGGFKNYGLVIVKRVGEK